MASVCNSDSMPEAPASGISRAGNLAFWIICTCAWFVFDRVSKIYFDTLFTPGDVVVSSIGGLIRFNLVHNHGVAWGAFAGAVPVIVIITALMCAAIAVFTVIWSKGAGRLEMFALALLFAGGVGNLVDRVAYGYVVDFITPLFIDFPTFNIADIGVTCGIALLLVVWIVQAVRESSNEGTDAAAPKE